MGRDRAAAPSVHRLSRDVTQLLLHKASLPSREIEDAADWMANIILEVLYRGGGERFSRINVRCTKFR